MKGGNLRKYYCIVLIHYLSPKTQTGPISSYSCHGLDINASDEERKWSKQTISTPYFQDVVKGPARYEVCRRGLSSSSMRFWKRKIGRRDPDNFLLNLALCNGPCWRFNWVMAFFLWTDGFSFTPSCHGEWGLAGCQTMPSVVYSVCHSPELNSLSDMMKAGALKPIFLTRRSQLLKASIAYVQDIMIHAVLYIDTWMHRSQVFSSAIK